MKKCAYCGLRLRKKDNFCPSCGMETGEDLFCIHAAADQPAKHIRTPGAEHEKKVSRVNGFGIAAFALALLSAASLLSVHTAPLALGLLMPAAVLSAAGLGVGKACGKRLGFSVAALVAVALVSAVTAAVGMISFMTYLW